MSNLKKKGIINGLKLREGRSIESNCFKKVVHAFYLPETSSIALNILHNAEYGTLKSEIIS